MRDVLRSVVNVQQTKQLDTFNETVDLSDFGKNNSNNSTESLFHLVIIFRLHYNESVGREFESLQARHKKEGASSPASLSFLFSTQFLTHTIYRSRPLHYIDSSDIPQVNLFHLLE